MIVRQKYLDELIAFQDQDLIKVVTGVRRCGKSTLLDMMREHLAAQGVPERRLVTFKMESMEFDGIGDYRDLYQIVRERTEGVERPYLFFDELQNVSGWEKAVNSLRVDMDCDIYVTGSNAFLLSSELATLLSGRYVEIRVQPLTFAEYLDFRGATWYPSAHRNADVVTFADGGFATLDRMLDEFRRYGGMPFLSLDAPDERRHRDYYRSLYQTVIVRDILTRERRRGRRVLGDRALLERVCAFMADIVGSETSMNRIAGTLRDDGVTASRDTVSAYLGALEEAYLFCEVRRYDIKGRALLKTGGKYYIVDTGLRSYLDGYRGTDLGHTLENMVWSQLVYDGFDVRVGHLRDAEVDFVVTRDGTRAYVQVTEDMSDERTFERELAPLRRIDDAFPKAVVVMRGSYPTQVDGIQIIGAADFFLHRRRIMG